MKTTFYSIKDFEKSTLSEVAINHDLDFRFVPEPLSIDTVPLSFECETISIFTNDDASAPVLRALAASGIKNIAVRAAGYDNVDLVEARALGLRVANVPAYSPHAIAEHAVALMLALNRKLITSDRRVHAYNFSVGGLVGFDLYGKTVGIIGTGKIGSTTARILHGFGCKLLGYDLIKNAALSEDVGLEFVGLNELCERSDIITIHSSLTTETKHLINKSLIQKMKPGVMLINTSRGALVETVDVIEGLQNGQIGYFGCDVYEKEKGVFFYDRSAAKPDDSILAQLMQLPNVLITPHQAFATHEAIDNIAGTTCSIIHSWANGLTSDNEL